MRIGLKIRQARELKGLSQSGLAERLGVKPQTVQQWESGHTEPRRHRISALASVLAVDEIQLLTDSHEQQRHSSADYDAQIVDDMLAVIADYEQRHGVRSSRGPIRDKPTTDHNAPEAAEKPRSSPEYAHSSPVFIEEEWLHSILDEIERLWGELPEDNAYLAHIISDGYARVALAVRESGRRRIQTILNQSLKDEHDNVAHEASDASDARKDKSESGHE